MLGICKQGANPTKPDLGIYIKGANSTKPELGIYIYDLKFLTYKSKLNMSNLKCNTRYRKYICGKAACGHPTAAYMRANVCLAFCSHFTRINAPESPAAHVGPENAVQVWKVAQACIDSKYGK